jgi:hypothetical protein
MIETGGHSSTGARKSPPVSADAAAISISTPRIPWWLWPHVLSLDAPLVAVLWQAALAKMYHVSVMPGLHISLFIAVWLIYIVDRVLDGFSMRHSPVVSARHAFYQRNRWLYILLVIPVATVLLVLLALTAIPEGVLWRGVALGFLVALYLLHFAARGLRAVYVAGNMAMYGIAGFVLWALPLPLFWKLLSSTLLLGLALYAVVNRANPGYRLLPKELLGGFLFAVGCSMGVGFLTRDLQGGWFSIDTLMLTLLCALNCTAISCYERETDAHSDPDAITRAWPRIARVYPALLITLAAIATCALVQKVPVPMLLYPAPILLSTLLLGVVHRFAKSLSPDLAHVLADAALVAPIAMILVAR